MIVLYKKAPGIKGGYKYQIKQEGYNDDDMPWELAVNLSKAKLMLDNYKKQQGLGERKVKRKRKGYSCGVDGYWLYFVVE
jgi:hypothetical protein